MMRVPAAPLLAVLLAGCSGITIQPVSDAAGAKTGYVVYEPTVYFTVGQDKDGLCTVGKPFVLPDYSRGYRISSRSGFGKSGVEVTITDGWLFGSFKDTSDNTAILDALKSAVTRAGDGDACPFGLYRLVKGAAGQIEKVDL